MPRYKFSEIAFNITDKRMPTPDDKELYIAPNNLDTDTLSVPEFGYKVDLNGTKLIMHKGDMLFGRREPQLKKAAIAPHDGLFSAHGMIFHPNEKVITNEFFPFFISSDYFFDAAIRISVGSLSPTVNWKDLKDLEFAIPDIADQQKYARILWAMIRSKKAYKDLIKKTDDLLKSQFFEMFGSPKEPKCAFVPLKTLTNVCSGGTPDRNKPEYWENGSIPWVKTTELQNDVIVDTEEHITKKGLEESSAKMVPPETILVAMYGQGKTRGMTAILGAEACTNQACACILPTSSIRMRFLWQYFICSYEDLRNLAIGSNQANLNAGMIKDYLVPVPELKEQIRFENIVEQSNKAIFAIQQSLKEVKNAQKALMRKVFKYN